MKINNPIVAAVVGTALEFYDSMLYTHFLFILTPLFFPHSDPFISSLLGMASFAAGTLLRPLGGVIFGHIGDRTGRRNALSLSIILISVPTFIMGILPTYVQIGILAPILLILCRLVQSFCTAGESTGASIFLVEHAKAGFESTASSLLNVAVQIGGIIGATLGLLCLQSFMPEWGWRIPFLFGAILGWIGYYIRLHVEESPAFMKAVQKKVIVTIPIREVLRKDKKSILRTMGVCAGVMAPFQIIYVYMGHILKNKLNLSMEQVIWQNIKIMFLMILILPIMGYIADKIGFRRVIGWSLVGLTFAIYPLFWLIEGPVEAPQIMIMQSILSIIACGIMAPCCVLVSSLFPTRERYSGYALGWSLGSILFAGLIPFLSMLLVRGTGDEKSPAYLLMFCGVAALIAIKKPIVGEANLHTS